MDEAVGFRGRLLSALRVQLRIEDRASDDARLRARGAHRLERLASFVHYGHEREGPQ